MKLSAQSTTGFSKQLYSITPPKQHVTTGATTTVTTGTTTTDTTGATTAETTKLQQRYNGDRSQLKHSASSKLQLFLCTQHLHLITYFVVVGSFSKIRSIGYPVLYDSNVC